INRKTLRKKELLQSLNNPETTTYHVTRRLVRLIEIRSRQRAFHPNSPQKILNISDSLFSVLRYTEDQKEIILTLVNVTSKPLKIEVNLLEWGVLGNHHWHDLISKKTFKTQDHILKLPIEPYAVLWLKARNGQFQIIS
ncbi:sugar phosphorylase, partial [candidate division KSB1 bacterium]